MYDIKATVKRDALVTPGSVFLFALGNNQRIRSAGGSEYRGLYSVRCQSSFPLQILAEWKLQGLAVRHKLVPPQPRQINWSSRRSPTRRVSTPRQGTQGGWLGACSTVS